MGWEKSSDEEIDKADKEDKTNSQQFHANFITVLRVFFLQKFHHIKKAKTPVEVSS